MVRWRGKMETRKNLDGGHMTNMLELYGVGNNTPYRGVLWGMFLGPSSLEIQAEHLVWV
jgi:hypothetical protein